MGSKLESRAIMKKAGVPLVPGTEQGTNDPPPSRRPRRSSSCPSSSRHQRVVAGRDCVWSATVRRWKRPRAPRSASAKSSFGDDTVYIEKKIEHPRHIEFQVLADAHGNTVHLFERECSIQRRHQKLIEETPSPALTPALRAKMGEAAVAAARAVGYVNAGTIEFMVDGEGNFYFLEMNTRIQVEHPVTELTTGIDLVQWQLRIARGEPLGFTQKDLAQRGHAIECRIYAEDETHQFMPSSGVIELLRHPSGPGIRNDTGIYEGWEVTPFYDPILSKLCAYGEDRDTARRRMLRALDEYIVHGVATGIGLHRRILHASRFHERQREHRVSGYAPRVVDAGQNRHAGRGVCRGRACRASRDPDDRPRWRSRLHAGSVALGESRPVGNRRSSLTWRRSSSMVWRVRCRSHARRTRRS
jgi:acetyl-CoA carboxylase biotin carboxylase subunit